MVEDSNEVNGGPARRAWMLSECSADISPNWVAADDDPDCCSLFSAKVCVFQLRTSSVRPLISAPSLSLPPSLTNSGTILLAVSDIFNYIRTNHSREFLLKVSYFELYNEVSIALALALPLSHCVVFADFCRNDTRLYCIV